MLLVFIALALGIYVGVIAVTCSQLQAYRSYLWCVAVPTVLCFVAALALNLSASPHRLTLRAVLLYLAIFAPIGILYSFMPGLMVKRGAPTRSILSATAVTTAVGIPIWYGYCLLLVCSSGDC
jgi:hypothetical protein